MSCECSIRAYIDIETTGVDPEEYMLTEPSRLRIATMGIRYRG